ncbi:transcriptional regulator [Paenibacillus xylanexedens]|uniref:transcriptional regulator n=1 Tax=Paenibacillus xylanexedens TaxID=528191 RepID=UPI00119D794D|nr:transcriptional regulator [Paenibacillus xylanexedens]
MSMEFDTAYEEWMASLLENEMNPRVLSRIENGLDHGTLEFLRSVWFPVMKNFNHLQPEWEVRDFHNGFRYLDLAYLPGNGIKGSIEIQGYGPHARDLDVRRFKDLCWRHYLLTLDDWIVLPIAYLSIKDEPKRCQQLVLSFMGKFIATDVPTSLTWLEAETVRYARRILRPFAPTELAAHLRITDQHARRVLHSLIDQQLLHVASGSKRYRTYILQT